MKRKTGNKESSFLNRLPYCLFPPTPSNIMPVKPDFYSALGQLIVELVNLVLVFPDIRDEDVAWLVVGHWAIRLLRWLDCG